MNGIYKWLVVGMLWFVCFFNYADRQAIFSVFDLLKKEMNLTDTQLGIIGGAFAWIYALGAPFAGWVGDRLPRKVLILGGMIIWSLITMATSFCTEYWQLVLVRALEGLGETFYFPASMSLIGDYHGRDTRSRAMAFHQSSVYAGTIAGGAISGYMGEHFGWRSSFYVFGGLGIVLAIVLWFLLKEPERGASETSNRELLDLKGLFGNRMVLVLMAVFVGVNFVAGAFLSWMPTFLKRKFDLSLSMAGFSGTAFWNIASAIGVMFAGWLADRLASRYRGGRQIVQAVGLLVAVPFIVITGTTLSIPVVLGAMVGFGFFKGFYDASLWAGLYDVVPVEKRAAAVGLMNLVGWSGAALAPIAMGYFSQYYGMSACVSANGVLYLLTGLLLLFGVRRYLRT